MLLLPPSGVTLIGTVVWTKQRFLISIGAMSNEPQLRGRGSSLTKQDTNYHV